MVDAASILRTARRQAGLSQRALAARAGGRQPLVSRIESARQQPSLATLQRLLNACGYQLMAVLEPLPDPGDLSLIDVTLPLTPQQRVDRLLALHRDAGRLGGAVALARTDPQ